MTAHAPTDCLFRDDRLSAALRRRAWSPSPSKAASCSTAPCSTRLPAASRATPARSSTRGRRAHRASPRRLHRRGQERDRACAGRPGAPAPQGRRCRHRCRSTGTRAIARMRMHTALHLLSAVLPYPVTGGAIGDGRRPARFRHPGGRPRQGRDHGQAERADRGRRRRSQRAGSPTRSSRPIRASSRPCR